MPTPYPSPQSIFRRLSGAGVAGTALVSELAPEFAAAAAAASAARGAAAVGPTSAAGPPFVAFGPPDFAAAAPDIAAKPPDIDAGPPNIFTCPPAAAAWPSGNAAGPPPSAVGLPTAGPSTPFCAKLDLLVELGVRPTRAAAMLRRSHELRHADVGALRAAAMVLLGRAGVRPADLPAVVEAFPQARMSCCCLTYRVGSGWGPWAVPLRGHSRQDAHALQG